MQHLSDRVGNKKNTKYTNILYYIPLGSNILESFDENKKEMVINKIKWREMK